MLKRHYGDLTGLSKQMVKQRHGEAQFKAWRRGYSTRPPEVSSFSQHYPGNDPRYGMGGTELSARMVHRQFYQHSLIRLFY